MYILQIITIIPYIPKKSNQYLSNSVASGKWLVGATIGRPWQGTRLFLSNIGIIGQHGLPGAHKGLPYRLCHTFLC